MKILSTGLLCGALIALTGCQQMDNMMGSHSTMQQHQINDSQIMAVLSTANQGEVMQAQTALSKLQTSQVRNYAQMMINEHTMNEQKGQALANRLGVSPQHNKISMDLKKDSDMVVNKLNNSSAKTIDKTYTESQVMVHRKVLMNIDNVLLPNAQNAELKNMLTETRAAVASHLQMAERLKAAVN